MKKAFTLICAALLTAGAVSAQNATKCAMPTINNVEVEGSTLMAVESDVAETDYLYYETVAWTGGTDTEYIQRVATNFTLTDNCEDGCACVLKYQVIDSSSDISFDDIEKLGEWNNYTPGEVLRVTRELGLDVTLMAYCPMCGSKGMSDIAVQRILFDEVPAGVEETVAGKTVASTRYFNVAGQEMSEANGLTIVLTTYTDGTTTASKVIK